MPEAVRASAGETRWTASLRGVLSRKCDLLEARAIFYEGELWMIDDEADLLASRFDYLDGEATLVVYGELTVDP